MLDFKQCMLVRNFSSVILLNVNERGIDESTVNNNKEDNYTRAFVSHDRRKRQQEGETVWLDIGHEVTIKSHQPWQSVEGEKECTDYEHDEADECWER